MSVVDYLSDISKSLDKKSGKLYGVSVAKVTNINDPEGLGRVKCKLIMEANDKEELDWAFVATFMGGKERGAFFLPEVDDEVLLAFDNGDIHKPYVIGSIWSKTSCKAPHKIKDDKNDIRKIKTRSGHEIIFNDEKGKESIVIHTPAERVIEINDEAKKISISDKDNKNEVVIDSGGGIVSITADKKIVFKTGSETIELDGTAGAITIKSSNSLKISSQQMSIEAAATMKVKAGSMSDLISDGMMNIKANMIKMG